VVFMVDFDTPMDRAMVQGVDVWLNTPRRPLEACGVGAMKAGMNGVVNFSTVDGWWDEALQDADPTAAPIGFTIGTAEDYDDEAAQDEADAASLYHVLENEIVPRFYDRDADGVPRGWLAVVKRSMATLAPTWDSLRMAREYADRYYLPGRAEVARLLAGGAASARDRARHVDRLRAAWPGLSMEVEEPRALDGATRVTISAGLGALEPADVRVQVWVARGGTEFAVDAAVRGRRNGRVRYAAEVAGALDASREDWAVRIIPALQHTDGDVIAGLVTWSW